MKSTYICELVDLPEGESRGFEAAGASLLLIRKGTKVFGYHNICPHVGTPLNWMPDRFLNPQRTFIQCATHGAQFEIETGACVFGPCQGQSLSVAEICIRDSQVYLVG